MKNLTLTFLFAATYQLVSASCIPPSSLSLGEANAIRVIITEIKEVYPDENTLFITAESSELLLEKGNITTIFTDRQDTFSPFYFVRKVELKTRSQLDSDHQSVL